MGSRLKSMLIALGLTLVLLIVLELFSSTVLPALGFTHFRIPFHILIVLYMGFRLKTPYIALLIWLIEYIHAFFSLDGWAYGTITGILICIIISHLKDFIRLYSTVAMIVIIQIFQILWFLISLGLVYLETKGAPLLADKIWRFLPESILISIMSPIFFSIFDHLWRLERDVVLGE